MNSRWGIVLVLAAVAAFSEPTGAQTDEPFGGGIICVVINDDGKVVASKIVKSWGDGQIVKESLGIELVTNHGKRQGDANRNRWIALGVGSSPVPKVDPSICEAKH